MYTPGIHYVAKLYMPLKIKIKLNYTTCFPPTNYFLFRKMVMSSGYRLCGPRAARRYLILVNMVIAVAGLLYIAIGAVSLAHGTKHKGVIFCQ